MRLRELAVAFWLMGSVLVAEPAMAQGGGGQGRFSVDLSTTVMTFPTPGVADFDNGWIEYPGTIVIVDARPPSTTWELRVRAESPDMGGYGKPCEDILWRTDGSATWVPLTNTDAVVLQGQGDQEITVYFRMRLGWDVDVPDTYSVDVTFTAVRL